MELSRDFKGIWIPKEIWLNKDLNTTEKCLLVEIDSLDRGEGCFASNAYLAEFIGISESRCASMISELRKRGYVNDISFDGRNRRISLSDTYKVCRNQEGSIAENGKAGLPKMAKQTCQIRQQSNIVYNLEENNKGKKSLLDTLPERELAFAESVNNFMGKYSIEMLKSFYDYWSEPNSKGKMRFELQDTWEISRRLATWHRNNSKFSTAKPNLQPETPKSTIDDILKDRGYA